MDAPVGGFHIRIEVVEDHDRFGHQIVEPRRQDCDEASRKAEQEEPHAGLRGQEQQ